MGVNARNCDEEVPKAEYATVSVLYHGDLAVDMYTPASHKLVWRGVARKTLHPDANDGKRRKNLDKAVAKLIKNYPPPK
jgi:hypothetical protein